MVFLHTLHAVAVLGHRADHLGAGGALRSVVNTGMRAPDQFIEHGTVPILREKHGLTVEATVKKIRDALAIAEKIPSSVNSAA